MFTYTVHKFQCVISSYLEDEILCILGPNYILCFMCNFLVVEMYIPSDCDCLCVEGGKVVN